MGKSTIFLFFVLQTTIITTLTIFPPANSLSFNFQGFKQGDVKLDGDAFLLRSEIHVSTNASTLGRVTSHKLLRLWPDTSFSTSFSFLLFSDHHRSSAGDGLSFFLAHPSLPLPPVGGGGDGGLGLADVDASSDHINNSFVAVEFDTFSNPWDPPGVHVGINVNSMESRITRAWFPDIAERNSYYNCIVEYNSTTLNLTVSLTTGGVTVDTSFSYVVNLREYLPEWVVFGFSAATGNLSEAHILQYWSFHSTTPEVHGNIENATGEVNNHEKHGNRIWLWVGLGCGIGFAVSFLIFMLVQVWKRIIRRRKEETKTTSSSVYDIQNMDYEFSNETGPKKFHYMDLVTATNNFSESKKLGQGGFGGVYKGYLLNSHVAIKRISKNSTQGIKEYATEIKVIGRLRHENLVQLLGWCHKKNDLLLVYEFMPNRSLDFHLYNKKENNNSLSLTWRVRYKIGVDIAWALVYLHEEWSQCVLHRDIKSSNVMLDSSFNAKLGDFGLARVVSHEKGSRTTLIAGTRGYIAPEYVFTGKAYKESDIYSFGVVLLEIASGRKAVDIHVKEMEGEMVISVVEWVWELYGNGRVGEAADPNLCGEYEVKEMERLLVVGLWCTYPEYKFRPSAREVIKVLNFEADLPVIPLTMPVPTYLPPTVKALFSSLSASFWAKC